MLTNWFTFLLYKFLKVSPSGFSSFSSPSSSSSSSSHDSAGVFKNCSSCCVPPLSFCFGFKLFFYFFSQFPPAALISPWTLKELPALGAFSQGFQQRLLHSRRPQIISWCSACSQSRLSDPRVAVKSSLRHHPPPHSSLHEWDTPLLHPQHFFSAALPWFAVKTIQLLAPPSFLSLQHFSSRY